MPELLKSQRNDVLETIRNKGLDPLEFEWDTRGSKHVHGSVSGIFHRPTGYYFIFEHTPTHRVSVYSPGSDTLHTTASRPEWNQQLRDVRKWLDYLKRESEAPDLWAEIAQETTIAEAASSETASNTPLTPQEQEYISSQLQEIKQYLITTHDLSEDHAEFVEGRLNYLEEAAKREGRQDWLHTAIGVVFTISVGIALAPGAARELLWFVTNTFRQLVDTIPSLPG